MKRRFISAAIIAVSLVFSCACDSKDDPKDIEPPVAAPEEDNGNEDEGGGGDVAGEESEYYITDGVEDPLYWVTNEYMQAFMEQVTYKDRDYSRTRITEFPGGGPGEADIPPAVNLTWENGYPDKKLLLTVWDDEWSREYNLEAGATSQELLHLVPKKRYSWKVITTSGAKVAEGTFRTAGSIHQVFFTNAKDESRQVRNGRDLGGWKTLDGKTVVYRKLYRGGRIEGYIDSNGKAEFRAVGLKAELDLRESAPKYCPVGNDIAWCTPFITDSYVSMLTKYKDGVKMSFEFIADCLRQNKPVFYHCAIGRDRTGTLSILVLGLLGVSEGDISKDYELTYFAPDGYSTNDGGEFKYHRAKTSSFVATVKHIWAFGKPTFKENVQAYLLSIGVTQKDMDDICAAMLK